MARRRRNQGNGLAREHKIMIGVGAGIVVLIATVATVAWASSGDPAPMKKAIEVSDGCTTFAIVSDQQLRDDLRDRLRKAAKEGAIDPLQVASRYVRAAVPGCPTYPARTETPSQAKLFAAVYLVLLDLMTQENLLSSTDFPTWYGMMTIWAAAQGVPAEDL